MLGKEFVLDAICLL